MSYGDLKKLYPEYREHWHNMQARAKLVGTDLAPDRFGYFEFVCELGALPMHMTKPTIGRKDYREVYVSGNYEWQEFRDNVLESNGRNKDLVSLKVALALSGTTRSDVTRGRISAGKPRTKRPHVALRNRNRKVIV